MTAWQVRVVTQAVSWVTRRVCVCVRPVINLGVHQVTCYHRSGKVTLRVRVRFRVYEETHLLDLDL